MRRYFTTLATLSSIIALALVKEVPLVLRIVLLVIGLLGTIDQIREDYKNNHENVKICTSQQQIEDAMTQLVKSQGKICIMSRDLSWVNPTIKATMKKKKDSLRVFAQKESELTHELIESGVEVHYYKDYGFEPKTRFTIIRYNRADPQVAIARTTSSVRKKGIEHKIYQTRGNNMQDEFICSLALDLMELCKSAAEKETMRQKEQ